MEPAGGGGGGGRDTMGYAQVKLELARMMSQTACLQSLIQEVKRSFAEMQIIFATVFGIVTQYFYSVGKRSH